MALRETASRRLLLSVLLANLSGCLTQRHPIRDALYLHNQTLAEEGEADCVWRRGADRDACPDPDIHFTLYTPADATLKHKVDWGSGNWLRSSAWDPTLETIFLIHGYAGGDDALPIIVLRDAYLRAGLYNVLMVDWGALCKPPCYVAAVHNLRPVARCVAELFARLRHEGLPGASATCVGHSLGAHVCGIMANYLPFRINRIIGLDPARPLVRAGAPLRLDAGDAHFVQVLHTNAGRYGEGGRLGHLDVCINGGRSQPFCADTPNEALCSHIWSICFQAESLFTPRRAEPCARRCPAGARPSASLPGSPLEIGQAAPDMAAGTYCLHAEDPPFCPRTAGDVGDERCCLRAAGHAADVRNETHYRAPRPAAPPPPPPSPPPPPPPPAAPPPRRVRQLRKRNRLRRLQTPRAARQLPLPHSR